MLKEGGLLTDGQTRCSQKKETRGFAATECGALLGVLAGSSGVVLIKGGDLCPLWEGGIFA